MRRLALVLATALLAGAAAAPATSLPERTIRVSEGIEGPSRDPVLSADGRTVAFVAGAAGDVVVLDLVGGDRRVLPATDGPSSAPALSRDGARVAYVTGAGAIAVRDLRSGTTTIATPDADGPSSEPSLSADGGLVAFTSKATNLVPGDANGAADVFVRDLAAGTTRRVSDGADGPSGAPAISADGTAVAFASKATNLVPGDTNGIGDVFVRDLKRGRTERVSVSSAGRQQDRAVPDPFLQQPDLSADGRYVVFDSDATTLVRGDANRRSDVFLRDRRARRTTIVSLSATRVQGDNDSVAPRLSADGRYVAFQSFASNLTPGQDGPREDVFLRDLRTGGTTVVSVADGGAPRGRENVRQLLQRPSLADDGRIVAFSSTAPGLVPADTDAVQDVFLRLTEAPAARLAARHGRTLRLAADDPRATRHLCAFDGGRPFACGATVRAPAGAHELEVRAGGPGMLYAGTPLRIAVGGLRIARPARGPLRVVRGTAPGASRVEVAVTYLATKTSCRALRGRRFVTAPCTTRAWQRASGGERWSLRLPRAIRGPVLISARAGRGGRVVTLRAVVR